MSADEEPTGIPTRAIHEAYLDMQRALKEYRRATDRGAAPERKRAHGEVQDAVLTLYEMLRPHVKHNSAVKGYWEGEPPSYPTEDGQAPDPEDGTAILACQVHPSTFTLNGTDAEELDSLRQWHEAIGAADEVRLCAVSANGEDVMVRYQTYEMGLRRLDEWETDFKTVQDSAGGFMATKSRQKQVRQRIPIKKLERASRALSEAANDLGFLSHTETPVVSDPDPI